MAKKRINKTKEQFLAEIKYERANSYMVLGMQIQKMMDLMKLWEGYGWEPSEVKVFHEMTGNYLQARKDNYITIEDVNEHIEALKSIGIDILIPEELK